MAELTTIVGDPYALSQMMEWHLRLCLRTMKNPKRLERKRGDMFQMQESWAFCE